QKQAAARPQRMQEVADALRALEDGRSASLAAPSEPSRRTLALAGFFNITARSEDDWLGTGLAETLAAELHAAQGLALLPREALARAQRRMGSDGPPRDDAQALRLGREAGASLVLSGAYQCLGERVRLTASLLDVPSGRLLRAAKLDGAAAQIFDLQ